MEDIPFSLWNIRKQIVYCPSMLCLTDSKHIAFEQVGLVIHISA